MIFFMKVVKNVVVFGCINIVEVLFEYGSFVSIID